MRDVLPGVRHFFLTDQRNRHRTDLRCPFGCRQAHRRNRSTQRSIEYYGNPEGKIKKKIHNDRRREPVRGEASSTGEADGTPAATVLVPDETALEYLQGVTSLMERRLFLRQEILVLLNDTVRQHSMERRFQRRYYANHSRARSP